MTKSTPHPPETDPASPYESLDSKKLNDAAERALDHYLKPSAFIMASTHKPEPMYLANPKYNTESLLVIKICIYISFESLAIKWRVNLPLPFSLYLGFAHLLELTGTYNKYD